MSRQQRSFLPRIETLEERELLTSGLLGLYYANPDLSGSPAASRIDHTVDFTFVDQQGHFHDQSPVGEQNFSVVWEGFVLPNKTADYTFTTLTDDGARLFVNGQLVIDEFHGQPPTKHSSQPIHLQAGHKYKIMMEYFADHEGGEEAHLLWEGDQNGQQVVAQRSCQRNC